MQAASWLFKRVQVQPNMNWTKHLKLTKTEPVNEPKIKDHSKAG